MSLCTKDLPFGEGMWSKDPAATLHELETLHYAESCSWRGEFANMQTEASIEIDRVIDEVFDLTTEDVSLWSITVVEDTPLDSTPKGVGSEFICVTEKRGRQMEFAGTIKEHNRPFRHVVELVGKSYDIVADYRFEQLDDRTRVTEVATIRPKGLTRVMFFLIGWMFKKAGCNAMQRELDNLKAFCESRP